MECNYADQLDLEWQSLIRKHLSSFSTQSNKEALLPFDTILPQVFASSDITGNESSYKDKEICEKCLTQCLHLLILRNIPPRQSQIRFLLSVAKYVIKDEPSFINLTSNNVIENLFYLVQSNIQPNEKDTNLRFLEFLCSFLEHHSGIKRLKETRYWVQAYGLVLDNQGKHDDICNRGYKFFTKLLEKSSALDKNFCNDILQVILGSLLNTSNILKTHPEYPVSDKLIHIIKSSTIFVVHILEELLERYSFGVLYCVEQLKINIASETICKIINDNSVKLVLYRVVLIISFFKLTDVFDGIKIINQDPLSVAGLFRIIEAEIEKDSINLVIELYYYALKYLKHIIDKIPKAIINNKSIELEIEIATLQLQGPILIGDKLDLNFLVELDTDLVRKSFLSKLLSNLSFDALKIASMNTRCLPTHLIPVYTNATKLLTKSRHLYSKSTASLIFEGLIYSLQDTQKYLIQKHTIGNDVIKGFFEFEQTLLEAILGFLQSFNLSWCDSVKILDLTQILNVGTTLCQWTVAMKVSAINIMQEVISRRLSPAMSLLIDCDEDLMSVGPILYQKLFTTEWEVRKGILELIYTISKSANNSFPSFKTMLTKASLPSLVSTMALNDQNPEVQATALKCITEMIIMENTAELLQKNLFLNKVLDMLINKLDSEVMVAAIKLITTAYIQGDGLEDVILIKVYETLKDVALKINDGMVQIEAIEFWMQVFKKHLSNVGWLDQAFPSVTFTKRIVAMTNEEIQKRICTVLTELSINGCLKVFTHVSGSSEVQIYLSNKLKKIHRFFQTHKVTPDTIEVDQDRLNKIKILKNIDSETDPESVIQELINDTMMEIMPEPSELFSQHQETGERHFLEICRESAKYKTEQPFGEISPLEFVRFVYKWSANEAPDENMMGQTDQNDVYNIIDY